MAGEGVCPECNAKVITLFTEGGKVRDLEDAPHEDGNHAIITRDDGTIRARVLTSLALPATDAYRQHACPPKAKPGPRCGNPECNLPMPREIAEALNWSTHPGCEPEFQDELKRVQRERARRQTKPRRRR